MVQAVEVDLYDEDKDMQVKEVNLDGGKKRLKLKS